MPGYEVWAHHGKELCRHNVSKVQLDEEGGYDRMKEMLEDV